MCGKSLFWVCSLTLPKFHIATLYDYQGDDYQGDDYDDDQGDDYQGDDDQGDDYQGDDYQGDDYQGEIAFSFMINMNYFGMYFCYLWHSYSNVNCYKSMLLYHI